MCLCGERSIIMKHSFPWTFTLLVDFSGELRKNGYNLLDLQLIQFLYNKLKAQTVNAL